jgi:hypothetical protein
MKIGGTTREMGRRWYFSVLALIGFLMLVTRSVLALDGKAPPMVEKHIFSPETDQKVPLDDKKSPAVERIERQIIFTGVISSPEGRRVMLSEKVVRPGKRQSELYKEGDEIKGMTIKKIGSNFIILAGEGNDVKLNLYQGEKMRPAPPALPALPKVAATPGAAASGQSASSSEAAGKTPVQKPAVQGSDQKPTGALVRSGEKKPGPGPSEEKTAPRPSNPFLEALKRAARNARGNSGGASSASNEFLKAIRGAQQQ